jgi:hypothetical protein
VLPQQIPERAPKSSPNQALSSTQRFIFRAEAFQHYVLNQEKVVLPPLVSPRVFFYLWLLAGLIMIAGLIIAFWPWIGLWVAPWIELVVDNAL